MNRFYLIPAVTIDLGGGNTSTFPRYLQSLRNPTGYACRFSAARYGRRDLWLVRVMDISEADGAALSGQGDVYAFPVDNGLSNVISDKAVIDLYFESYRVPTDWTTPSTTYQELLRSLAHMAQILQRYFGIAGEELFTGEVTLETRFRDLASYQQTALQSAVNELSGQSVPINQNNTLRQLLKAGSEYFMSRAITIGDFTL